ncbi:hypothetical protein [Sphingomonas parapaucimobilis]|uniref:hypothetical protein n=1 Tax=Sphingomonas parapaucimobilis TaxID=28213 RepID=UPI00391B35CC
MPAALPLIAGAFLAAGSVATAVGLGTAFVVAGLAISWTAVLTITGVALMAVSYLARKTPKPDSAGSQLSQKLDPQAGVPIAFGRTATGGVITDRLTWGAKNAMYGIVTVLSAGGPIAGIEAYRAGDYPISFNTSPATATASVTNVGGYSGNSKLYRGKLRQRWQNGDAPATTTPGDASGFPMRGGALSGLAHVVTSYEYNADAFPQGLPTSVWTLRGVRLYDPRQDSTYPGGSGAHRVDQPATWTYSENPYLAALQWTLGRWENGRRVYGIGAKWSEVDVASFVTAANVADANGWKIGGVVSTLDDKYAVLASILAAGGGVPVARGAQIAVSVNAPKTSVLTLTAADIIGDVEMSSSTSFRDRQNTIIPRYREESKKWEIISGERVSAAQYVTEDGGEQKTVEIEFPFVQQAAQAHQLAAYELVNSREFLTFTVRAKQRLLAARVGDCINVTVPEIASRFTKCLVAGREFNPADMSVTLTLKSETDAKHAFALGQTQVAPPSAKLDGYDPSNPGAPAANAWSITDTTISNGTTTLPVIVMAGQTDDPNASTIIVEYRPVGSATWLNYGEFPRTTSRIEVSGLTDATAYEIALSYRTVRGVIGDRLVMSATAGAFKVSWDNSVAGPGKPANNADVTGQNTSRDTANVGGRPSSQIVAGIDKLPSIRDDIDKALAAGQAVADREQAAATPPGLVSNIQWSSVLTDIGADVTLTWTAAKVATSYEVELSENGGGAIVFAAPATSYRFAAKRNTAYSARVRALKINVPSGWVSAPAFSTGRDTVAPAAPTSLSAVGGITWIDVATVAPGDADQAKIRFTLYRSSDNAKIGDATVSATANTRAEARFNNLSRMAAYYVTAVAIDSSDNVSSSTANVPVTTANTSIDDLTPGLVPPQTVTSLPNPSGWTGSPVVFYGGELYRLSGGAWTKSVSGQDIIDGTVTGAAIAPQALSEEKLVPNTITARALAHGAVTGDKIATKTIAGDKIIDATIGATQIMSGGVGTQQLATNSVVRDKIAEAAIDQSRLAPGAVGSQQLAPAAVTTANVAPQAIVNNLIADRAVANTNLQDGAVTARVLAIGNFDNVIPDGDMRDLSFWKSYVENGSFNASLEDQWSAWKFTRRMRISAGSFNGAFTRLFPVEIGATYKLTYSIYVSPDFSGWFLPTIHQRGVAWNAIKAANDVAVDPTHDNEWAFHAGDTRFEQVVKIFTVPAVQNNSTNLMQFRFDGSWTAGYIEFMVNIVRVSDSTLIKDGSITTDKIVAGAITGDKIAANQIAANKLQVQSRPVSTVGLNIRVDTDNAVRWNAGSVMFVDDNSAFTTYNVTAGGTYWSSGWGSATLHIFYNTATKPGHLDISMGNAPFDDPRCIVLASWSNNTNLVVYSGTGTLISGGQIVTGSIKADQIQTGAITINSDGRLGGAGTGQVTIGGLGYTGDLNATRGAPAGTNVGNTDAQTVANNAAVGASDPAARINNYQTTTINGGRITTGSITANQIAANTITGNNLVAGTISAAQIASGAITATKLAIGNPDNIIPDGDMRDPSFWNSGIEAGAFNFALEDQNNNWKFGRRMTIYPGQFRSVSSRFFNIEMGASYKLTYSIYLSPDFAGWFLPSLHQPGIRFLALKGTGDNDADVNNAPNSPYAFRAGETNFGLVDHVFTVPAEQNNLTKQTQFRFDGNITAGYIEFMMKIVRVSDSTLIQDGAITTDKITVNSLNGDRISVGTLDANRIVANSVLAGSVVVGSTGQTVGAVATSVTNTNILTLNSGGHGALSMLGNTATFAGAGDWPANAFVYSSEYFRDGCRISFKMPNQSVMAGIADTNHKNSQNYPNYTGINFTWHMSNNGKWYVGWDYWGAQADLGTSYRGVTFGNDTLFVITYNGFSVVWYADGVEMYRLEPREADVTFFAKISFADSGRCTNIRFEGYQDGGKVRSALGQITDLSSDNIISRVEKTALMNAYSAIERDYRGAADASIDLIGKFGDVTYSQRVDADGRMYELSSYLGGLSPGWNDVNQDTPVNGATLRDRFYQLAERNRALNTANSAYISGRANDPATRVNEQATLINPGRIQIQGSSTLSSWKNGNDSTEIRGGAIATNTVTANKLTIGNRGISFSGLNFQWNEADNTVFWTTGYVTFIDDNNNTTTQQISAGATSTQGVAYWQRGTNIVQWSNTWEVGTRDDTVRLAWWVGGSTLVVDYGGTIIHGDRITTGSIDANRIKANTVLANTVIIGGVSGSNTIADAFKRADYSAVSGAGKPETYTVMARGNQTSNLPANYAHGMRSATGGVFIDTLGADLRSDNYGRSYTLMWRINADYWAIRLYDVYGSGRLYTDDAGDSGAAAMAARLNSLSPGTPVVIFTSDEPASNRLTAGLDAAMYRCGASRATFGSPNFTGWSSYILVGTAGIGEGNGLEAYRPGGADSFVAASFSIVNGVVQSGGKTLSNAADLRFTDGRIVEDLRTVQAGATVGAPSGTYVGNTEAQTVTNWAYTGQQDPAGRINRGETTTINGGRITTGSVTALQIAANTITADRLNVTSLSALSANIGDVTAGVVRNASGSAKFDLTAGRIVFDNGSVMKVSGNGFGSSSQFIEWFGPRKSNLSDCTEQNASYYLKTDGSSYFGGSLSAGTTKNAVNTTSTATNANVTTGTVGSRGGTRVVVLSYGWSWTQSVDKPQSEGSGHDLSAQIVLSRNGADVATLTATGEWYRDPAFSRDEPGYYREGIGGSITFTDNSGGSSVSYSARLTSRNTGPGPQNGSSQGGTATQNISIVQTEQ